MKTVSVGDQKWEIRDDGVPVDFVDLITEGRHNNGIVYLSLATGIVDGSNEPIAQIASRLRMHLGTAQALHALLGAAIKDAMKAPAKGKTN
jgi:hypothetical protein